MLREHRTYLDIAEKTGASTATISRVNRSLNYGNDGYEMVFARMKEKEAEGGEKIQTDFPDSPPDGDRCCHHWLYRQCDLHTVQHCGEKDGAGAVGKADRQAHGGQRGSGTDSGKRRHRQLHGTSGTGGV